MLNENIKAARQAKGLSQEELAIRLNVVRQTVSKWERGLSVPDSEMLLSLSEALETPVGVLLGETVAADAPDALKAVSEKLEVVNLQLARQQEARRRRLHLVFVLSCVLIAVLFVLVAAAGSPYLSWDYGDPETAVAGVALHAFEWGFVRLAPFALAGAVAGAVMTRRKR